MKRYLILIIFFYGFSINYAQSQYSRKLQENIEVIQSEFNDVFQSGWIGIINDTIRINFESNGAAEDWVIIPVLNIMCETDSAKIIFKCISQKDTVSNCIERKVVYMNKKGESSSFNNAYYLWMYNGNEEQKKNISAKMLYIVEEIKKQK